MVDRKGLGDIENASFVCPNCGGTHARVAYELEEVEQDSKKLLTAFARSICAWV